MVAELLLNRLERDGKAGAKIARALRAISITERKSYREVAKVLTRRLYRTRSGQIGNWDANKVKVIVDAAKKPKTMIAIN